MILKIWYKKVQQYKKICTTLGISILLRVIGQVSLDWFQTGDHLPDTVVTLGHRGLGLRKWWSLDGVYRRHTR